MKNVLALVLTAVMPTASAAQSVFDGTWKTDVTSIDYPAKPSVYSLIAWIDRWRFMAIGHEDQMGIEALEELDGVVQPSGDVAVGGPGHAPVDARNSPFDRAIVAAHLDRLEENGRLALGKKPKPDARSAGQPPQHLA